MAEEQQDAGNDTRKWTPYVTQCLTTLAERGTDHYGPQETPLLMAVLDVSTLTSPQYPAVAGSLVRLEGRIHRRGERGSNLWYDQPMLSAMYEHDRRTGQQRFTKVADDYMAYYLEHCRKPNGMLAWGSHIHWDCYRDRIGGDRDGAGPHEILVHHALWERMYALNAYQVQREIDLIWQNHIHNKQTGRHNRHDDGQPGADFPFSAGSFIEAFAFMHSVSKSDTEYLRRAKLVTDWHWHQRHRDTNLVAFEPGNLLHNFEPYRFYGTTFASAVTGPHAARLLGSYELTGDEHFRRVATSYLLAYDKYGWQEDQQTFVGMLNLDGTVTELHDVHPEYLSQLPDRDVEPNPEYSIPPIGPVDVWQTTVFPLDFPLVTAQSSLYAYELTPAEQQETREALLTMARHWAVTIEQELPAHTGRTLSKTLTAALPGVEQTGGTYAGNYGRAISFFVHLYRATDDPHYLEVARSIAADAVDKLYVTTTLSNDTSEHREYGIFRGHPAKPYYETVDGVGLLLYALLELDAPKGTTPGAF